MIIPPMLSILVRNLFFTLNPNVHEFDNIWQNFIKQIEQIEKIEGGIDMILTFRMYGGNLLHYAVNYRHLRIVETLIDKGMDVNEQTDTGISSLQLATNNMNLHKHRFCKVAGVLSNNCNDSYIRNFQPDNLHIVLWGHLITLWHDHYIANYDIVQILKSHEPQL